MGIPALDRGLQILDYVIAQQKPCKYSEIRDALNRVGDASLNRLLRSLLESGHLQKTADGQYELTARVRHWARLVASNQRIEEIMEFHVLELSRLTQESAAFCVLEDDRIVVVSSAQCLESIRILQPGGIVHFESDHAAALSILTQLGDDEQRAHLAGEFNRTESYEQYIRDCDEFRAGSMFADRARLRLGVTRCAAPVACQGKPGSLFLCLPTLRFDRDREKLLAHLDRCAEQLKADLARVK